jgi:hypothetical protein
MARARTHSRDTTQTINRDGYRDKAPKSLITWDPIAKPTSAPKQTTMLHSKAITTLQPTRMLADEIALIRRVNR